LPDLPACSSRKVENALKRLGFVPARQTPGSHRTYSRAVGKRIDITVVPMAKKRIPDGTLKKILQLASVSIEEFRSALR
jgi:predicted RNA binding protein YcfA (HicA-like mRNA interferase family)